MATSQKDIDDIVRRVLERLSGPQDERCTAPEKTTSDELVLHEPVISAGLLTDRLNGAQRLAHAPGAVITPAARDILHQQEIEVRTYETKEPTTGPTATIGIVAAQIAVAPLQAVLKRAGLAVDIVEMGDVIEMVKRMSDNIQQNSRGVMVTDQTAAALCIANRRSGVRAVQAQNVPSMRSAAAAVGANFLVIDPQGMSGAGLARVVKDFLAGGPNACPETLRHILD